MKKLPKKIEIDEPINPLYDGHPYFGLRPEIIIYLIKADLLPLSYTYKNNDYYLYLYNGEYLTINRPISFKKHKFPNLFDLKTDPDDYKLMNYEIAFRNDKEGLTKSFRSKEGFQITMIEAMAYWKKIAEECDNIIYYSSLTSEEIIDRLQWYLTEK